jgi:hypothetical protein
LEFEEGQSFDMCKLVETTMLKPEIIQTVVPTMIGEIKTELISELKSVIKSAVTQAIEDAIKPLQDRMVTLFLTSRVGDLSGH